MRHGSTRQKLVLLILLISYTVMSLFLSGCVSDRNGMTDEQIYAKTVRFLADVDMEQCTYMLRQKGERIERRIGWSCAYVKEYPEHVVYFDGAKTYLCEGKSLTDLQVDGVEKVSARRDIEELRDFSFEEYDELLAYMLDTVKKQFANVDISAARFNYEHITSEDYIYYDLEKDVLHDPEFIAKVGHAYDSGFVAFHFMGAGGEINALTVVLSRYTTEHDKKVNDYFMYDVISEVPAPSHTILEEG